MGARVQRSVSHHKRGKPRQQRAGCPMCKWYKLNANKDRESAQPMAERRARLSAREQGAA